MLVSPLLLINFSPSSTTSVSPDLDFLSLPVEYEVSKNCQNCHTENNKCYSGTHPRAKRCDVCKISPANVPPASNHGYRSSTSASRDSTASSTAATLQILQSSLYSLYREDLEP